MRRIVDVPALVPGTVRFGEDLHEEIPVLPFEEIERQLSLPRHCQLELRHEPLEVGRAPPDAIAVGGQGIRTHARQDVAHDLRRRGVEAEDGIVPSPLHYLEAVQMRVEARKRDIEYCDSTARVGRESPERGAAHTER
jgi:hypothetical protein